MVCDLHHFDNLRLSATRPGVLLAAPMHPLIASSLRPCWLNLVAGLATVGLAGCASIAAAPVTAAPAADAAAMPAATAGAAAKPPAVAASGAAAAASPPAPGQPPAFATVIKDAKKTDGLLPIWRKDDKVWLEIPAALFDKPLLFNVNIGRRHIHHFVPGILLAFGSGCAAQLDAAAPSRSGRNYVRPVEHDAVRIDQDCRRAGRDRGGPAARAVARSGPR